MPFEGPLATDPYRVKAKPRVSREAAIEEFSLEEAFGEEYVKDTEDNGIKVEKGLFVTKYSQVAELDLTTLSEDEQGITMAYQVKLPAKVTNSNATEVLDNGKTLKWNLTGGEVNKIEFTAQELNILPIAIIVVISVAVAAAVFKILNKKHATKKENSI